MAKRNWPDHPLVGKEVQMLDGRTAVVVDVKCGPMYADMNSKVGQAKFTSTIRLRLKPAGGRELWSGPMTYTPEDTTP